MPIDLDRARRETPGCETVLHLNNAGAALMPQPVVDAVADYLQLEARIGGYEAAEREHDRIERVYDAAAKLMGCSRDEIALVEHATRAWDMAFYSIPFGAGDRILTAVAEYAANYVAYLQVARRTGAVVEVIPNDEAGQISVDALRDRIDERVKLISITHVPTNGGLVNPAAAVGAVAREAGVFFLLDACQSVGQMPMNVDEIRCDMLSATGRKYLRGPRGTGFLYVRRGVLEQLEPPMIDHHAAEWIARDRYELRSDARRFENWEANYGARLGLGVAIDYALGWGLDDTWRRVASLAADLRARMRLIPGVTVRDVGETQCGIVTFTVDGMDPMDVKRALTGERINVSVILRESTRVDMETRGIVGLVRASVHYYNCEHELERFCAALASLR